MSRLTLLSGTAIAFAFLPGALSAQEAQPNPSNEETAGPAATVEEPEATNGQASDETIDEYGGEDIVVMGQKPRGSVVGDIPPENVLDPRDIRATGATSINELLDSLASQIGSARGRSSGRPITLLNGRRISGFREIRDLPPEAIERMEILPEEVALKYGYSADQRVVNIVLRRRFNSTNVELRGQAATEGGYLNGRVETGRLIVADGSRTSISFRAEGNSSLFEDERDIALQPVESQPEPVDPRPFRTLVGSSNDLRLTATHNRTILGDVSATINGEAERTTGKSRFGVPTATLDDDGDEILRAFPELGALTRDSKTESLSLGTALNWDSGKWRWSSTGSADYSHSVSNTDNGPDLGNAQSLLDTDPTFDPLGDLGSFGLLPRDRSRSNRYSLALDGTATGPLLSLPAGDATATFRASVGNTGIDSEATTDGFFTESDLSRSALLGAANIDLPVTKRSSSIGRLTANLNGSATHLSDFGTITTVGAGLSWAPAERLNLTVSWNREEGPPSLQQLGDPLIETPNVSFFDFSTGETVLITTFTGGNPDLLADTRNVLKIGGNWKPFEETDLRLRAEYVRQTIDDPQGNVSGASETLEAAFPDRFVRDESGTLVAVDLRPVNFQESRRDTFRWGFDFTKPLTSRPPSEAARAAFRERFAGQRGGQGDQPPPPSEGGPPSGAGPGGGEGGPRGFGGGRFGGGRQGGRLTFSLTHQLNLVDEVTIADGVPELDYLHGEPIGQTGGRPRHEVQFETGYYNNGYGARLQGNWRSGTEVDSSSGDLKFSPYFDLDLRLFANLSENFDLVSKHPFFRGTSVRFDVNNIFNNRPKVRDEAGLTPLSYQPDLLEPIGRTVGITFRKLFIPRRFFQRRAQTPSS
ncbi:TonB-dependent receptor plug domain-containing protein [Sphingomonas sp. NSE70-1]|uniref:TonB-dependent receptor plug domain-containing protein n=1 Tax=Sphingomonas caseinilyticus TaxID=2908205 RepID=A0ABT0RV41_9SPHN|nr:TonB-dependent receptor plug domain-containing protein [Sphingomonas caseinilyticus]MCL6698708.1 TonB-dependent receptor plug domain-containing protein [Sphingomonas caseinilyticus]